jgi:hypothetical protein
MVYWVGYSINPAIKRETRCREGKPVTICQIYQAMGLLMSVGT